MNIDVKDFSLNQVDELLKGTKGLTLNAKVKDFMRPDPSVLKGDTKLIDALTFFLENRIDGVPVIDDHNVMIGLLTKTLALREIHKSGDLQKCIKYVMKTNPAVTEPDEDVSKLITINVGSLPVLEDGRVVGIVTLSDTVRAYFSSVLMLQEELNTLLDSTYNGIITVDTDCRIRLINSAALKILGLSGPDVFGQPISKFLPDSKLRDIINTGTTAFGRKLQFNSKTFITNDSPLKYKGKITGAVTIFQDISDLENISQELKYTKELKEELDTIVESSFDGIYLTDSYGKILRTNSALTRITGIKKEELSDRTMTELVDNGVFDQAIEPDVMQKGKPITISQRVKTGKTILVTSNPILDPQNNVFRIVHNARDITELNNLKNQLEKAESLSQHYKEQLNKMKLSNKFIAKSKKSRELVELVLRLSGVDTTVLILGESGVGKDIIAEMLHENSHRQDKLFLAINCAAIPDNLLESELFGYEPGAFTGAHKKGKLGAFELANGGTLFLDEIAELPVNLQSKLLRVLQKKEITKLGGNLPVKVDVRIITATNRDLWEMALNNTFRKDLYYRLNIVPITISPLRDRKEEIPDLVSHFTRVFNKKYGFNKRFDERSIHEMMSYDWPGNVRELENVIERSIVTSPDDIIYYLELPNRQSESNERPSVDYTELEFNVAVECFERELIKNALIRFGTTRKAAAKLGVSQPTVVRKVSKYNIKIQP